MLLPLLKSKLAVPPVPASLVPRQRLFETLAQGLIHSVTLVSAPAGFGKTTLLSQWISERIKDEGWGVKEDVLHPSTFNLQPSRFAWLSLDRWDNDPHRFWRYFIAALNSPEQGEVDLALADLPDVLVDDELAGRVEAALGGAAEDVALVLDDYHLITAQPVHDSLAFVIENMPARLHLFILTRTEPPLPLSRLRVCGRLVELHARDLRFTRPESMAFLNRVMGLSLSEEDLAALDAHTEGWAAGLQLAALSMRDMEDPKGFLLNFAGTSRLIGDYLAEQVLDQQSEAIRSFLLETSVLEKLCGPLCDAVLDEEPVLSKANGRKTNDDHVPPSSSVLGPSSFSLQPSSFLLDYLERSNLFLNPLDDERRWYRYHPFFARFLQERLRLSMPDRWLALKRRAAEWCQSVGLAEEAVQYALEAQDYHLAARLIETAAVKLYSRNEVYTVLEWMKALPAGLFETRPQLCVAYAWALALNGLHDSVEPYLHKAESLLQQTQGCRAQLGVKSEAIFATGEYETNVQGSVSGLLSEIDCIRSYLARFRGDLSGAIHYSRRVLEQAPLENLNERCIGLALLGRAQFLDGDLQAADRSLIEAVRLSRSCGDAAACLSAVHYLAQLRIVQGRLRQAAALYREAIQFVGAQDRPVFAGVELAGLGSVLLEWNELDQASKYIQDGLQLAVSGGEYEFLRDAYLAKARLEQALGRHSEALAAIDQICQLSPGVSCDSVDLAWIESQRARLLLLQGDLDAAERWALASGLQAEGDLQFLQRSSYLTLARLFLLQNRYEDAARLLDRLLNQAQSGGWVGPSIEAHLLLALLHQARKELPQAFLFLEKALILARPEGYLRTFLDEGPPLAALLEKWIRSCSPGPGEDRNHANQRTSLSYSRGGPDNGHRKGNGCNWKKETVLYAEGLLAEFVRQGLWKGQTYYSHPNGAEKAPPVLLSERELQVLLRIAEGKTYQEIARELLVALSTVQTHVKHVYHKLDAHNGLEAAARARQLHLIP